MAFLDEYWYSLTYNCPNALLSGCYNFATLGCPLLDFRNWIREVRRIQEVLERMLRRRSMVVRQTARGGIYLSSDQFIAL